MKRCSFKVAKVVKEAGYPQDETEYKYTKRGNVFVPINRGEDEKYTECDAPTYLDVWLWLWRVKKIWLSATLTAENSFINWKDDKKYSDPEEAIIAAIEYLVNENLLK